MQIFSDTAVLMCAKLAEPVTAFSAEPYRQTVFLRERAVRSAKNMMTFQRITVPVSSADKAFFHSAPPPDLLLWQGVQGKLSTVSGAEGLYRSIHLRLSGRAAGFRQEKAA
jgi:hypothetical protein